MTNGRRTAFALALGLAASATGPGLGMKQDGREQQVAKKARWTPFGCYVTCTRKRCARSEKEFQACAGHCLPASIKNCAAAAQKKGFSPTAKKDERDEGEKTKEEPGSDRDEGIPEVDEGEEQGKRAYPPFAKTYDDTSMQKRINKLMGAIEDRPFIQDDEILGLYQVKESKALGKVPVWSLTSQKVVEKEVAVKFDEGGRAILQQQSRKGCGPTSAAMLLLDHKVDVAASTLQSGLQRATDLVDLLKRSLEKKDLGVKVVEWERFNSPLAEKRDPASDEELARLKKEIDQDGPAIIGMTNGWETKNGFELQEIGEHFVVLDGITLDQEKEPGFALVRDPYHGWGIRMTLDALRYRWAGEEVIQVKQLK